MTKLFALTGNIQNYAWGGRQFIPELLSKDQKGQKVAEYWLGAHVNSPSIVATDDGEIALNSFLESIRIFFKKQVFFSPL